MEGDTRVVLEAIKEQGARTEHAIETMADRLVEALKHWGKKNGYHDRGDRGADLRMIAVVVSICFGLMSPLGIVTLGLFQGQNHLRESMQNEETEQRTRDIEFTTMTGRMATVEAANASMVMQFVRHSDEDMDRDEKMRDWQSDHDLRVRGLNAAQWERIRSLERQVFGHEPPPVSLNGY